MNVDNSISYSDLLIFTKPMALMCFLFLLPDYINVMRSACNAIIFIF